MAVPAAGAGCIALVLGLGACTPAPRGELTAAPPAVQTIAVHVDPVGAVVADTSAAGFKASLRPTLDSLLQAAVRDNASPGSALAVGRYGRVIHLQGYGRTDAADGAPAVGPETVYDLASLTKVIGTTTAAMILEEQGLLDIEKPIRAYLPELSDPAKASITVRMILTHTGGFEAFAPLFNTYRGREQYLEQINARPLAHQPGSRMVYSDWDLILLQAIVERLSGAPLDVFLRQRVWTPLGMMDTGFNPPPELRHRIAPTEIQEFRGGKVHGVVHDENAWALGGVAGHAGLFSSARDLAIFAQMLLNGGAHRGVRILKPETVARWTARQSAGSSRALGWDTPSQGSSAGRYMSPRSFGHTGFTGTSIWVDPQRDLFVILLSNRVNPTRANQKISPIRRAVADAVHQAITDAPLIDWEAQAR
ncbi:MAG: beta-lactamase family protein [Gemmatimonadetes bacterium]|nr:beta-lactamase family protein [Gemmatimonadota bacterium]